LNGIRAIIVHLDRVIAHRRMSLWLSSVTSEGEAKL
jgi:hypothetical protein